MRVSLAGTAVVGVLISGCGAPTQKLKTTSSTQEYFSEAEYGVKASIREAKSDSDLRRGGGRYHIGKPYKVRGRWYHPKEDPDYVAEGGASWYGDAFHGRLTANGEVYDMNQLTAAHPTMPLPSYARVTNLKNGSSVVVRVNDRGPFAKGRVIDLSKRAAKMLDYAHAGVAKVRVEYLGLAPLDGQDEEFLVASYQPGDAAPGPSKETEPGVMLALNAPAQRPTVPAAMKVSSEGSAGNASSQTISLPQIGPLVPDRPATPPAHDVALLSYADGTRQDAGDAFKTILQPPPTARNIREANSKGEEDRAQPYIVVGRWESYSDASRLTDALSPYGRVSMSRDESEYVISLAPEDEADLNPALRAAWSAGATDAFILRD